MKIIMKCPEKGDNTDIQLFFDALKMRKLRREEKQNLDTALNSLGSIKKIGYGAYGEPLLVSIEKKDGCLYVEIDESQIVSMTKDK